MQMVSYLGACNFNANLGNIGNLKVRTECPSLFLRNPVVIRVGIPGHWSPEYTIATQSNEAMDRHLEKSKLLCYEFCFFPRERFVAHMPFTPEVDNSVFYVSTDYFIGVKRGNRCKTAVKQLRRTFYCGPIRNV